VPFPHPTRNAHPNDD
jgi:density-regulated protein DRP1